MQKLKIKLFADGANAMDMMSLYNQGIVSGFTTNPTLMKKAGITNYEEFAKMILKAIPDMPISFEVFSNKLIEMEQEATKIASWGNNVYVKIPITNTLGESTIPLIDKLVKHGIKINVTAIMTIDQVNSITNAIRYCNTPNIISVFAGRIADTGRNPESTMKHSLALVKRNKHSELLWASTRELYNIIQAQRIGCHIITVTPDILKKLPMIGKDLTELSLDTVKMFYEDAKSAGYQII